MINTAGQATLAANRKLNGLDHLRAFAITFVFLFHYGYVFPHPAWMQPIGKFGWSGVDLFFILSGYLIASQLFKELAKDESISFKAFFIKRAFRIIPAYATVVAIYFCVPYAREREALAPLWKYVTFTQNLGLDLRMEGTFSHAWSLCIEEQFYLALPLILILLHAFRIFKKGVWLLTGLFLSGFIIRYCMYRHFVAPHIHDSDAWVYWHKAIYYPTYCRLDGLLTGVGIAVATTYRPVLTSKITKFGNGLFLLGICILAGAFLVCTDEQSFAASIAGFPLVSAGYGAVVLAAISPSCFLYNINSRVTTTIAALSYAIYLTHKIVIHIVQDQLAASNIANSSNLMFMFCIVACLLAALLLNKVVEKPFLKLRDKFLKL